VTLLFREASGADIDALSAIEDVGWTRAHFEAELGRGLLVAEDGEPVGFAALREVAGEAQVYMIAVRRRSRGRGIGHRLLEDALNRAKRGGCFRATLEVSEKNTAAIRLYEEFGFAIVGRRSKYYNDGADALLMDASL